MLFPIRNFSKELRTIMSKTNTRMGNIDEHAREAERFTNGIAESAHQINEQVSTALSDGMDALRDAASSYVEDGRVRLEEIGRSIEHQMRRQPVTSLLVVGAVGFLVGAIWNRR
jgi:ElaB/YqjD/DUF883 family membrane-anchored ribosome-binding protein